MADGSTRIFTNTDATEARAAAPVPLLIGLTGPSSSGKTYTALRLATGIQTVYGGDIFVVDTEQRRSLHYADRFKFRHVAFGAPFGSLEYLAALRYCKAEGAGVVVIDSASHEHDGPGGMLEQHDTELTRMAGTDFRKREAMAMLAWSKPKQARRQMITGITTELNMPVIFCFRAKSTTKPIKDKSDGKLKPVDMGYMAIAGEEWLFEMSLNVLFLPGAEGAPTWQSDKLGEKAVIKTPAQFKYLQESSGHLDEEVGRKLAIWAKYGPGKDAPAETPTAAPKKAAKIEEPIDPTAQVALWADQLTAKFAACETAHQWPQIDAWWNAPAQKTKRDQAAGIDPARVAEVSAAYEAARGRFVGEGAE